MIKKELKKGINLYMVKDDKFKAFKACILIHRPLKREEVTLNSLLGVVMRMQSESFLSQSEISKELENLYGAALLSGASKYGEHQLLKISINSVSDEALGKEGNFERAMKLLGNIAFCAGRDGAFSEDILSIEKKNLADAILAQKNDKRSYSVLRLQQEMCDDEPYGINSSGYIEDIEKISAQALYKHYRNILEQSRIDVVLSGNFSVSKAQEEVEEFIKNLKEREPEKITETILPARKNIKNVTDKMDVTQGKLCMGFRSNMPLGKNNYPAAIVYNSIFGGSAVSKLFNNVREKLSLCYYVGSSIDRLKEIMIVRSGVEFENFKKANDEIMLQQKMMEDGDFSKEEILNAKKQLIGAYESNLDSVNSMMEYYIMQILLESDTSIEEMTRSVENVTREEIIQVARSMKLDTVYYIDKE